MSLYSFGMYAPPSENGFAGPQRPAPYDPIAVLLDRLPQPGACWPREKRDAWFKAVASIFDLIYVETAKEVTPEREPWWVPSAPRQVVLSDLQAIKVLQLLGDTETKVEDFAPPNPFAMFEVRTPSNSRPLASARKSTKGKKKRKAS